MERALLLSLVTYTPGHGDQTIAQARYGSALELALLIPLRVSKGVRTACISASVK